MAWVYESLTLRACFTWWETSLSPKITRQSSKRRGRHKESIKSGFDLFAVRFRSLADRELFLSLLFYLMLFAFAFAQTLIRHTIANTRNNPLWLTLWKAMKDIWCSSAASWLTRWEIGGKCIKWVTSVFVSICTLQEWV